MYRWSVQNLELDARTVLLDQQHGLSADGNLIALARELSDEETYGPLELYFALDGNRRCALAQQLSERDVAAVPVTRSSMRYYQLLAGAKYLITDTSLPLAFVKRAGQVLWNTWHGTPLKTLGRREGDEGALIGNVQKSFMLADYISVSNEHSALRIVDDYMVRNLSNATMLFADYPRNAPFSESMPPATRAAFISENAHAYAYLPTFRFSPDTNTKAAAIEEIRAHLAALDKRLEDGETLFVKLHPAIEGDLELDALHHIAPIPTTLELYEFLALCDVLVTDYSSVMFDFAITGRKIVLFAFDEDRYEQERGLYLPLNDLPFPTVHNVDGLVHELRSPKSYDDAAFIDTFAPYRSNRAAKHLCEHIFNGARDALHEQAIEHGPKPRALVYVDELPADSEFEMFDAFLARIAKTASVTLAFPTATAKDRVEFLAQLPEAIGFMPLSDLRILSPWEWLATHAARMGILDFSRYENIVHDAITFEVKRSFGDIAFDSLLCLARKDWKAAHFASAIPANRTTLMMGPEAEKAAPSGFVPSIQSRFRTYVALEA